MTSTVCKYWRRAARRLKRIESDFSVLRRRHRRAHGRVPGLSDPRTFNEKILWLNLRTRDPRRIVCADKYAVRDWVAERIGADHLVPLLGVYEAANDIELDALPDAFVIKATHASGWNLIVRDRRQLDWEVERRRLDRWLAGNYYHEYRERHYRDIPPRLVVEELLLDEHGNIPEDYKLLCMAGGEDTTILVQVDVDRFDDHRRNFFDLDWNRLPFELEYPSFDGVVERPERLEEMVAVARRLSDGFPFVRVDLYGIEDRVYFGELTFTPEAGNGRFRPKEWDLRLGQLIELRKSA